MSDALRLPLRPNLDQYRTLARDLQRAVRASNPAAFRRWASRWPNDIDRLERRLREFVRAPDRAAAFKLTDAHFFIAREHGFASWPAFAAHLEGLEHDSSPVALFESAVDAIVSGHAEKLRVLLRTHPDLARARSTRDHRSTLLHYVSANGVEDFRQVTPANIVALTEMLLAAGSDVNAVSEAYGGGSTPLGLVATSAHPEQAGVQIELLETLLRHGANVEGEQAGSRHGLVLGCLANGQPEAARFFADRGASLNLIEAAGLGLIDRVRAFLDNTSPKAKSVGPGDLREALQYATNYEHAEVVQFLLAHAASAGMTGAPAESAAGLVRLEIATSEINLCALSEDGRRVLVASQGNPVTIFDVRTGKREMALDADSVNAWLARWTSNPKLVLIGSRDRSIGVWDTGRGERVSVLRGHDGGVPRAADTNAACTHALTGCSHRDASVKLWDLASGACLRTLEGHDDGVYSLAFGSHDKAASGSRDTTIRIWDLASGQAMRVLKGHTYHVHSLAWSSDGQRLLSTSRDLRLWDAGTGHCLQVFEGHTEVIRTVVWSPGERHALSASHDRTARLWDVDTGRCLRVFEGHDAGLVSASFSAEGRRVVTCDWLGGVRSWLIGSVA